ncbi:MAG: carbohydrate kinase family protein [Clostridiales Family XIII bacterium]|jgi:sugar/nucleoside kinase (ribokinase family)|nr:carbohydrate kinase family protein [Clostridiales Family XIII bacterium]
MDGGICLAGNLIVDRLKFIERWPCETELTTILRQENALGGLACTCAIDIAKLDPALPVSVVGIVGEDDLGDAVLAGFAQHPGIDASLVKRCGETSYTDVMTAPDGRRTFFVFRGANARLSPDDFDFSVLRAGILHIGYILLLDALDGPDPGGEYETAMCRVLDGARKAGILTSVDVVTEAGDRFQKLVRPALAYTDVLSINETEAAAVTGVPLRDGGRLLEGNLEPCARELAACGVAKWACIHMPELSCGLDVAAGAFYRRSSVQLPEGYVRSSVGAGDAFAAGLLLGLYRGEPLPEALRYGNAAAAVSLSSAGASVALKPLGDVLDEMAPYGGNALL